MEKEGLEAFSWIYIDGSIRGEERQMMVDRFQNEPGVRFAVLSTTCAGIGLTLTAASTVVFAE